MRSCLRKIGSAVYDRARSPDGGEDWMFSATARLCNGISCTKGDSRNILLLFTQLNLHSAELSVYLLAFANALEHVKHGLEILSPGFFDMWKNQFNLAFTLQSIGLQDWLVVATNWTRRDILAPMYCNEHGKQGKALPAHKAYLDVLACKSMPKEGLDPSISIFRKLLGLKLATASHVQKMKVWLVLPKIKSAGQIPTKEKI